MGVRQKNPVTPGLRGRVEPLFEEITEGRPEKSLLITLSKSGGRDNAGRVSIRHRGGGNKTKYRVIDFKRVKDNIPAKVLSIQYDPNRNARLALLQYTDGVKSYILAPSGIKPGDEVMSGEDIEIKLGNATRLRNIPEGIMVHNVELTPGKGGQIARSAGAGVVISAKEGNHAIIKLNSGEERMIHLDCRATIGQVGNLDAKNVTLGKAGRTRYFGIRPTVRGVAMNPCDHPHGGGEGKSPIGRPGPVSPWGKPTLGYKTRKKRKNSSRFILRRRK